MAQYADKKGIWGWMLFDWAGQPFHTLVITFFFGPYFVNTVVGNGADGQTIWAFMVAIAGILVAVSAPFMGAAAEKTGPRKPWLLFFGLVFVIGTFGLWSAVPDMTNLFWVYIAFIAAFVGAEYIIIFSNAMLPDLVPRKDVGRLSGSGWALGYVGGMVILVIMLLFISPAPDSTQTLIGLDPLFGLDGAKGEPARATGPISAIWFIVFALPLFLFTPDIVKGEKNSPLKKAFAEGFSGLRGTWAKVSSVRSIWSFFLASMLYRDGLIVLYTFGAIYARSILGWEDFFMGIFGIVSTITGALGAWLGGKADARWGSLPVVRVSIFFLLLVSVIVLSTTRDAVVFVPVAEGSGLPDIAFFLCGAIIGAAGGSMQASSRALVVHVVGRNIPMTEAYGIYALSGKATAFIGPALIGLATWLTGSQRLGISPVILLFLLGLVLLIWVKPDGEESGR